MFDGEYDRERLALMMAAQLPLNNETEARKVLALIGQLLPVLIESRAEPVNDGEPDASTAAADK